VILDISAVNVALATRRVRLAGITTNPDGRWVAPQARNLVMQLDDDGMRLRFLIRDRDSKFSREFDEVFRSEGIRVIKAPVRAPKRAPMPSGGSEAAVGGVSTGC
jgi:putative transposase